MISTPWDCAQPDEWLPQSLRLCWGGDSDGGDAGGSGGGGGDSAAPPPAAAIGAVPVPPMRPASMPAMQAWAWRGAAASTGLAQAPAAAAIGAASAPPITAAFDAPNPTFADVAGPNPGVNRPAAAIWGSASPASPRPQAAAGRARRWHRRCLRR